MNALCDGGSWCESVCILPCLRVCVQHTQSVCILTTFTLYFNRPFHNSRRFHVKIFVMKTKSNLGKITLDTAVCSNDDLAKAVESIKQVQEGRKKLDEGLVQVCSHSVCVFFGSFATLPSEHIMLCNFAMQRDSVILTPLTPLYIQCMAIM